MSNRRSHRESNQPSILLSNAENKQLFDIIGGKTVTLATAVVQLYVAPAPNYSQWTKKCCGVVGFIKDNGKRSYFIRVYNLKGGCMIWEQELYNQFKYYTSRPFFHSFDGNDCPVGLNFANEEEANSFKAAVCRKLDMREQRKIERKRKPTTRGPTPPINNNTMQRPDAPPMAISSNKSDTLGRKSKDKKKNKKKGLTKEDIGTPTDFRHVGHVGWDPDNGFDMNNLDPSLKKLFDTVGISDYQLKDKETAKFIYDFIDKHGGLEALKKEQQFPDFGPSSQAPPPPPSRHVHPTSAPGPPRPPPNRGPAVPPPPPPQNKSRGMGAPPPPPPSRNEPPPPPSRSLPPPPPPSFSSGPSMPPPPPPSMGGGGPPPPPPPPGPPPPPALGPPPPPLPGGAPRAAHPVDDSGEGHGALLDQIRAGRSLAHVDHAAQSAPAPVDSRSQLLNQIRGGKILKKVDPATERPKSDPEGDAGIAAALANALANRADKIQVDSDEEDEEDDDSDWD